MSDGQAHRSATAKPSRRLLVYVYCRVSTQEMFVEGGVSGSVPFAKRPQGGKLARRPLPDDIVVSPKLDRCFRSARDALTTIQDFKHRAGAFPAGKTG